MVDRILVVTAHPDDVDFGAAGTVATWTDAGIEVSYCIATDGAAGGPDGMTAADLGACRRAEQIEAAAVVGVHRVDFLDYPDGRVGAGLDLRLSLTRVLRSYRPDRVVTHSPVRNIDRIRASHPDHLAVGEATFCSVYPDARNPHAFPELAADGLAPHVVPEIWVMTGRDSTAYVDVTDGLDRKIAALACHRSQHSDPAALASDVRRWAEVTAAAGGLPAGRYAESFRVVSTA
jgi:LmbE family N-acetylglucosaminyl deacetylase